VTGAAPGQAERHGTWRHRDERGPGQQVTLQAIRDLDVGPDRVNINGGAIALGHPIGASGARIALHLVYELQRRGGGLGAAGLCGGGGQGEALVIRVPAPAV